MEKLENFVKDGAMKLPPGFRFQPTDEDIVFEYLTCKNFSSPLPSTIIPEINLCKFDPWDLPGDSEQERHFFCKKEAKYQNGNRTNRATPSGYWKATGSNKQVVCSSSRKKPVMGMKKTLVFHKGKKPLHCCRTDWIMHEYHLVKTGNSSTQNSLVQMGDWVLCRIFLKKRSMESVADERMQEAMGDNSIEFEVAGQPMLYDFMSRNMQDLDANDSSFSCSDSNFAAAGGSSSGLDCEATSGMNWNGRYS